MSIKLTVSKTKYDNLLAKLFGDDFIHKGGRYRISSWGTDEVKAIQIDRLGGKSISNDEYVFIVE